MTVKELIERLQQFDQEMVVRFRGSEFDESVDLVELGTTTVQRWVEVPNLKFDGGGTRQVPEYTEETVVLLS